MAMKAVGFKIDEQVADLLENLCNSLGPPKYKILEAAIEVFAALPKEAQYVLKSQNDADRKIVLEHLRKLNLKSGKGKVG